MSHSFGTLFKVTTFGESHGPFIGCVIEGMPPNIEISEDELYLLLQKRRPGASSFVSPRNEPDRPQIVSGLFEGKTTGTPICVLIENQDVDSSSYESIKNIIRPQHAQSAYLLKYGIFDYRGGGRASGRETATRVIGSYFAKKLIPQIQLHSSVKKVGQIEAKVNEYTLAKDLENSQIQCPDKQKEAEMIALIQQLKEEKDSIGGIIETRVENMPFGLGEPVFDKLEARLGAAMLSIPGVKGFEIGSGFSSCEMKGTEHVDEVKSFDQNGLSTNTNHAGGVLGGISTAMPLVFRVAIKPTSSIQQAIPSVTLDNKKAVLQLSKNARHDPCIALRALYVVKAMCAMTLADFVLLQAKNSFSNELFSSEALIKTHST